MLLSLERNRRGQTCDVDVIVTAQGQEITLNFEIGHPKQLSGIESYKLTPREAEWLAQQLLAAGESASS
jgi:hypothetical protein